MKTRAIIIPAILLVALSATRSAQAQQAATAPAAPTSLDKAMPSVTEVVDALDKASTKASGKDWSAPVRLAIIFAILALLPTLLVMITSFTRIVIVLSFVRRALSTQTIPPTIAIIGLALFLTLFTMAPTFETINKAAIQPYLSDKITFQDAMDRGKDPLKEFMLRQTKESDLGMFVDMSGIAPPNTPADLPLHVVIPAFAISEFRTAFEMGCLLFIPFLVIDLVISGILLATGMMMLPPVMISLPLKIILFVMVDGWRLLVETLVTSFR